MLEKTEDGYLWGRTKGGLVLSRSFPSRAVSVEVVLERT